MIGTGEALLQRQTSVLWKNPSNLRPSFTSSLIAGYLCAGEGRAIYMEGFSEVAKMVADSQVEFHEIHDFQRVGPEDPLAVDTDQNRRLFSKTPRPDYIGVFIGGSHTCVLGMVHVADNGSVRDGVDLLRMAHLYNVANPPLYKCREAPPCAATYVLMANNVKLALPKKEVVGYKFGGKEVRFGGMVTSYDVVDKRSRELIGAKLKFIVVDMSLAPWNVSDPLSVAQQCICFFRSNVILTAGDGPVAPYSTMWLKSHLVNTSNTLFLRAMRDLESKEGRMDMQVYATSWRSQNHRATKLSDC